MKRRFLAQLVATGLAVVVLASLATGQTSPPMGGGYTNVIAIPVDDPKTKAISGALFKPEDAGPFPAVIVMPTCAGVDLPKRRSSTTCKASASRPSLSILSHRAVSCTGAAVATSASKTSLRR